MTKYVADVSFVLYKTEIRVLKGVLIDFKTPFVFVGLHRVYLLADADIYFLESSDQILLIRIVKKTNLIKANQRRLLS